MSVFVLAQSLNIHLTDILGVRDLMEHIEFHQTTYGDSLLSFIAKHYGDKMLEHKGNDENDKEHHKLPFDHHRASVDQGHVFVFSPVFVTFPESVAPVANKSEYYYYNLYSFLENSDIFQPPRTV